ncbi:MAG: hypothetical protein NTV23_07255 [Propionibacteriales bacterium]|nr:hypothetical protein [Propionibacteriales bacterium]
MADNDDALRALIANGSATANELRTFLERNQVDLGSLINNLVTTGNVIVKHLPGIRQVLVMYPYLTASGFTVAAKNSEGYNARFGFVLTQNPAVCTQGYDVSQRRSPTDGSNRPMDEDAGCTAPDTKTNARGAQNAPRVAATYDLDTKALTWGDRSQALVPGSDWATLLSF